ncbi:MAG: glycoside hydrolase domain-containing protein [Mangrovibacterium sp.]
MTNFFLTLVAFFSFVEICAAQSDEIISTKAAREKYEQFLKGKSFLAFPELREKPLKWFDSIPEGRVIQALHSENFVLNAHPGEFFVYQLGVWAQGKDVSQVQVQFSGLTKGNSSTIPVGKMTCFNAGGIDFKGLPFTKEITVPAGRMQALWIGIDLSGIDAGNYKGSVAVKANGENQVVPLLLKIAGDPVEDHGYSEGKRLSRLNWLNSTVGIDEQVTKGYPHVKAEGKKIAVLGRTLEIAADGLPSCINSHFTGSNESLAETGAPVVSHPFRFIVEKEDGKTVRLSPGKLTFTEQTPSKIAWKVVSTSDECELECTGQMEFDGFVDYRLKLTSKMPLKIKDVRLEIPVVKEKAEYMMGLGHEGGTRTADWKWKWDTAKNQDMLWVGSVNGGLRVKWKAENYVRPLVNIYYEFGKLKMPPSWGNAGRGGVDVTEQNKDVLINAYSGKREMNPGEHLNYDFELLITPLKVLDRKIKFGDRYYHGGGTNTSVKVENAKEAGANIINIHHAEDIYPFINYPYLDANVEELKQLVKDAHDNDLRMKVYYTTRELTKNLPEFWAFNSLNGEVIFPGPGNAVRTEALHPNGPNEWLIKNLREKYIPAWFNLINEGKFKGETDLSVITTPDSRLNNFYIAGLDWMVRNMGIDGVYIDDSALDRFTLRRARKIIDQYRPEGRMDLHSWNHFCNWAGFASCLNLYMDLLPYFDLVWIGEGRDYNRKPDHWLVEVSGIPFGLSGQMLEGGGNPWRGMVYGITNRAGWTKNKPDYLWKFFDDYHFEQREMIGYWEKDCPVKTNNPELVVSVFKGSDDLVLAVGNWSGKNQTGSLLINWKNIGIKKENAVFITPAVKDFQEEAEIDPTGQLKIEGGKGIIVILKQK